MRAASTVPPDPSPFDTLARKNPPRGESTAIERRTTEDRRPERLKPPDENLQEAGEALSTLGNVPVLHADPDPLGVAAMVENVNAGEVEPPRR